MRHDTHNKNVIGNQNGFALILALLTLALLASLGMAAMYQSNTEVAVVANEKSGNGLLMAADSGAEFGKNFIWTQSGFANNTAVSFANLDNYFAAQPLPVTVGPLNLAGNTYYSVTIPDQVAVPGSPLPVSGYDTGDGSKRIVTFQSQAWEDTNGNGAYDLGERSRMVTSRVAYEYGSLSFPYGVLTQNTECIFCHARIVGDVVSLTSMTVRKFDEAFSTIMGDVYTMGTTNLDQPLTRVVSNYNDQDGDLSTVEDAGETALNITTNYSDPSRFPVDQNGNPSFPEIQNLGYYQGLAAAYDGGNGSTITGAQVLGVPMGGSYGGGTTNLGTVTETYSGNLMLTGTPGNCIQLNGPVVVEGDVIISGCVSGEGSVYAGGNVYVPASVTYTNASNDRLGFAAGGNIVVGDYRDTGAFKGTPQDTGGGKFIDKQLWQFNSAVQQTYPAGQRRYYSAPDGLIYSSGKNTITPVAGDTVVSYTPSTTAGGGAPWITDTEYINNFADTVNGVTQLDALAYTANGIFANQKAGNKQMTINGALVSADIGMLVPGPDGKSANYDPANTGLTLVYDNRMETFLSVARNPNKRVVSWREGA